MEVVVRGLLGSASCICGPVGKKLRGVHKARDLDLMRRVGYMKLERGDCNR